MSKWKQNLMMAAAMLGYAVMPVGCSAPPPGNTDPELFRLEYSAVAEACELTGRCALPPLGDIEFAVMPFFSLQEYCPGISCAGAAWDDTVLLPDEMLEDNPCAGVWFTEEPAARVIVHELIHIGGIREGAEHLGVVRAAWAIYRNDHCGESEGWYEEG